ncbi:MAG: mevalonate kinase [Amphritea sp.]
MIACAPGKLILSGEHSVVYGAPAIALAVKRHVISHCAVTDQSVSLASASLSWSLPDLKREGVISWADLVALGEYLDQRYTLFEQDRLPVGQILESPQQLLLYAVAQLLPAVLPATGISLEVKSQLPAGAGMGSSAAATASVLTLFADYFGHAFPLTEKYRLVRYCERLCHGRGGMIDAATVTHGGLIQVQDGQIQSLDFPLGDGWYYVNSGNPAVGTGECVDYVRQQHASDLIWQRFADITEALMRQIKRREDPLESLHENHQLLSQIGVVPEPVSRFIEQLEKCGGAGKISGAGAIRGNGGGALVVYAPNIDLTSLCDKFGYSFLAIEEDSEGARLCN